MFNEIDTLVLAERVTSADTEHAKSPVDNLLLSYNTYRMDKISDLIQEYRDTLRKLDLQEKISNGKLTNEHQYLRAYCLFKINELEDEKWIRKAESAIMSAFLAE